MDASSAADPPDVGINVPCNKPLSLPMLLNFLKSDTSSSLLDILKTNTTILLECGTCRNIFRDLGNFLTHRIQFCPAEGAKRRALTFSTLGLETISTTKVSPKECSNNTGAVRSCCPPADDTLVVQARAPELRLCDNEPSRKSSIENEHQTSSKQSSQNSSSAETSGLDSQLPKASSSVCSNGAENKRPHRSRLDTIVSQLREKSGFAANSTTLANQPSDNIPSTSARNEHQSTYNLDPPSVPPQQESNLTISGSRHKPYNQTTENFSAVISFAQSRCLVCRKVFQSRKNLVHHARLHHRDLLLKVNGSRSLSQIAAAHQFPCKICGHVFQWRSSLWRHTKEKHSRLVHSSINTIDDFNTSYQNSFLDSLQGSLAMQDDKTTDESSSATETSTESKCQVAYSEPLKPFSCDYCSVRFSTPKARRKHVKSKHPENYTSSRAKNTGILLDLSSKEYDQMLQQTLPNPPGVYPCPDCGLEFRIKASMISHRARKHNNKNCAEQRNTASHDKSETSSTSTGFSCSICGSTFPLMLSLKVHVSKKHGRPKPEKQPIPLELKPEVKIPKPTVVANHNYETKSASRARAFVNQQQTSTDKVATTSEIKTDQPESAVDVPNELSCSLAQNKPITTPNSNVTVKSKSRTPQGWVNPHMAEYLKICDLDTFTCSICDLNFADRKKLFLHLNRVHLTNNSHLSNNSSFSSNSASKKGEEVVIDDDTVDLNNDVNVSSTSASSENSQLQLDISSANESSLMSNQSWSPPPNSSSLSYKTSSRKIRNYSKICNFDTLSCKLCPRKCANLSQLQNHAVYKHMDMIELVPMREEVSGHATTQNNEASSNHYQYSRSRRNSAVEEDATLDLTKVKTEESSEFAVKKFPKPGDKRSFDCTKVRDESQNGDENGSLSSEGMATKKHTGSKIRVK